MENENGIFRFVQEKTIQETNIIQTESSTQNGTVPLKKTYIKKGE